MILCGAPELLFGEIGFTTGDVDNLDELVKSIRERT
jgi:hypothetical protein